MVSTINKIFQVIRDIIMLAGSSLMAVGSYGKWVENPIFYMLYVLLGLFVILAIINMLLLIIKTENRGYFYFNTIFQSILLLPFTVGPAAPFGM